MQFFSPRLEPSPFKLARGFAILAAFAALVLSRAVLGQNFPPPGASPPEDVAGSFVNPHDPSISGSKRSRLMAYATSLKSSIEVNLAIAAIEAEMDPLPSIDGVRQIENLADLEATLHALCNGTIWVYLRSGLGLSGPTGAAVHDSTDVGLSLEFWCDDNLEPLFATTAAHEFAHTTQTSNWQSPAGTTSTAQAGKLCEAFNLVGEIAAIQREKRFDIGLWGSLPLNNDALCEALQGAFESASSYHSRACQLVNDDLARITDPVLMAQVPAAMRAAQQAKDSLWDLLNELEACLDEYGCE